MTSSNRITYPPRPVDAGATALMIVDPDFMQQHVGVRRVTFYYANLLLDAGFDVRFASSVEKGKLRLCDTAAADTILLAAKRDHHGTDKRGANEPCWTSGQRRLLPTPHRSPSGFPEWNAGDTDPDDYTVSVITNPWLCRDGALPERNYTIGIVHDLVPNMLASSALRFGFYQDIFGFAVDHDTGYRFFERNVSQIACVSENTRQDFLRFYAKSSFDGRVIVNMPFQLRKTKEETDAQIEENSDTPRLLLVNVLDPRKNYKTVVDALSKVVKHRKLAVTVVGRERMDVDEVMIFLSQLSDAGAEVEWYRDASAACLTRLYVEAAALVFPSLYEGLGLPILEAQSLGTPVISSNTSSCAEINLNPTLCVPPTDADAVARTILGLLDRSISTLRGDGLQQALYALLTSKQQEIALPALQAGEDRLPVFG